MDNNEEAEEEVEEGFEEEFRENLENTDDLQIDLDNNNGYEGTSDESWDIIDARVENLMFSWTQRIIKQREFKDLRFIKEVEEVLKGVKKMNTKLEKLDRRRTLPRTWRDNDRQIMYHRPS